MHKNEENDFSEKFGYKIKPAFYWITQKRYFTPLTLLLLLLFLIFQNFILQSTVFLGTISYILYSQALRFSTFLSQTGNSQALACFSFNRKIIFYGSLIFFLIFSKESLFSFAEGSLFFYAAFVSSATGLCPRPANFWKSLIKTLIC